MKISSSNPAFMSKNVILLDGGGHGCSMEHFARAIFKNTSANVQFEPVRVNPQLYDMKFMDSLEDTLKRLLNETKKGDFIIIPALALATLSDLQSGIKDVLGIKENLTPQNLKAKKHTILEMLKKIYADKLKYVKELEYLDPSSLELGSVWGVINQVNKHAQKGVNVYIPTGHPIDYVIKGMADSRGERPDLYRYIATGEDRNGKIEKLVQDAKSCNYYNLNMLSLSDANIVNVEGLNHTPYIYGAYDSLANDSERGVYNFYPVRDKSGKVLGYSFRDKNTIEYSYDEYGGNESLSRLLKFTGLQIRDFLADKKETDALKKSIRAGKEPVNIPDKLYKISDIYDSGEIQKGKLNYYGDFITRDKLTFDVNKQEEILFQKCNCEGSSRPSVVSMWGSCFASIRAALRDYMKQTN